MKFDSHDHVPSSEQEKSTLRREMRAFIGNTDHNDKTVAFLQEFCLKNTA